MTDEKKHDELSFEELLNESVVGPGRLEPGQRVEAQIVDIGSEWVFLGLGGKSEGFLDKKELLDEDGTCPLKIGDTVSAYFLSSSKGEMLFTTRITGGEAGRHFLEDAFRNEIPVEGLVETEVKGGYRVKIAGDTMAFCPHSQMGLRRVEDSAEYVGQRMPFMITEYSEKGRNVILSNKMILEAEARARIEELKGELSEGMRITGPVVSIQKFGAFVDIGGVQGLLPISEIGWEHVDEVGDVLSVGQEVETEILSLDWEKNRIALSRKATLPDPWDHVGEKYPEGSSHVGKVARLTKFGAFVTLEGGVDGLVHISKIGGGKRINHPNEVLEQGQVLDVTVKEIDLEKRRLSLVPTHEDKRSNEAEKADDEDYRTYLKNEPTSMGTLGDLLRKK